MSQWYDRMYGGRETVAASVDFLMHTSLDDARRMHGQGLISDDEWEAAHFVSRRNIYFHPSSHNPQAVRPHTARGRKIAAGMIRELRRLHRSRKRRR